MFVCFVFPFLMFDNDHNKRSFRDYFFSGLLKQIQVFIVTFKCALWD